MKIILYHENQFWFISKSTALLIMGMVLLVACNNNSGVEGVLGLVDSPPTVTPELTVHAQKLISSVEFSPKNSNMKGMLYSPDKKNILVGAKNSSGNTSIFAMDVSGANIRIVTDPSLDVFSVNGSITGGGFFYFTSDSKKMIFMGEGQPYRGQNREDIYSVNLDGTNLVKLNEELFSHAWNSINFHLTPDNKYVIYIAEKLDSQDEIFKVPIGGGPVVKLFSPTNYYDSSDYVGISNDSSWLVVVTQLPGDNAENYYKVNLNDGSYAKINQPSLSISDVKGSYAFFIPLSNTVIYTNDNNTSGVVELHSYDLNTDTRLTISSGLNTGEIVNSKYLSVTHSAPYQVAYVKTHSGNSASAVSIVNFDGSSHRDLAVGLASTSFREFAITPLDNFVLFILSQSGSNDLLQIVASDGNGSLQTINHPKNTGDKIKDYKISLDEGHIVYSTEATVTAPGYMLHGTDVTGSYHNLIDSVSSPIKFLLEYNDFLNDNKHIAYIANNPNGSNSSADGSFITHMANATTAEQYIMDYDAELGTVSPGCQPIPNSTVKLICFTEINNINESSLSFYDLGTKSKSNIALDKAKFYRTKSLTSVLAGEAVFYLQSNIATLQQELILAKQNGSMPVNMAPSTAVKIENIEVIEDKYVIMYITHENSLGTGFYVYNMESLSGPFKLSPTDNFLLATSANKYFVIPSPHYKASSSKYIFIGSIDGGTVFDLYSTNLLTNVTQNLTNGGLPTTGSFFNLVTLYDSDIFSFASYTYKFPPGLFVYEYSFHSSMSGLVRFYPTDILMLSGGFVYEKSINKLYAFLRLNDIMNDLKLVSMDIDGSNVTEIFNFGPEKNSLVKVIDSIGNKFLYKSDYNKANGNYDLYTIEGSVIKRISTSDLGPDDSVDDVVVSESATSILYTSRRDNNNSSQLFLTDIDGAFSRLISSDLAKYPQTGEDLGFINDSVLYFVNYNKITGIRELNLVNTDGSGFRRVGPFETQKETCTKFEILDTTILVHTINIKSQVKKLYGYDYLENKIEDLYPAGDGINVYNFSADKESRQVYFLSEDLDNSGETSLYYKKF